MIVYYFFFFVNIFLLNIFLFYKYIHTTNNFSILQYKEITYKTLSIQDFVTKLLFHLPYKHFKMINRFGFYARRKSSKLKLALTLFKSKLKKVPSLFRKNFKAIWCFDPFMCPNCSIKLEVYELFVSSAIGRPIHKFYNPNGLLFK
ncbi:transposase [Streptobacillus canis]|uniref:transposase n=1 Tax=Streptobacillus canis TaxID=2678686 RepID=UPI0018CC2B14|nr:transposase [Streptobacillus canis]